MYCGLFSWVPSHTQLLLQGPTYMYNMNVYIVVHIVHNFSWVPTKTCCTYYVLQGLMYKKYILCMNFRQGTNTKTTITPNEKCWVDTHHSTTSTAMTQQLDHNSRHKRSVVNYPNWGGYICTLLSVLLPPVLSYSENVLLSIWWYYQMWTLFLCFLFVINDYMYAQLPEI